MEFFSPAIIDYTLPIMNFSFSFFFFFFKTFYENHAVWACFVLAFVRDRFTRNFQCKLDPAIKTLQHKKRFSRLLSFVKFILLNHICFTWFFFLFIGFQQIMSVSLWLWFRQVFIFAVNRFQTYLFYLKSYSPNPTTIIHLNLHNILFFLSILFAVLIRLQSLGKFR